MTEGAPLGLTHVSAVWVLVMTAGVATPSHEIGSSQDTRRPTIVARGSIVARARGFKPTGSSSVAAGAISHCPSW